MMGMLNEGMKAYLQELKRREKHQIFKDKIKHLTAIAQFNVESASALLKKIELLAEESNEVPLQASSVGREEPKNLNGVDVTFKLGNNSGVGFKPVIDMHCAECAAGAYIVYQECRNCGNKLIEDGKLIIHSFKAE